MMVHRTVGEDLDLPADLDLGPDEGERVDQGAGPDLRTRGDPRERMDHREESAGREPGPLLLPFTEIAGGTKRIDDQHVARFSESGEGSDHGDPGDRRALLVG